MEQFKYYLKVEEKKHSGWLAAFLDSGCLWNIIKAAIVLFVLYLLLKSCDACVSDIRNIESMEEQRQKQEELEKYEEMQEEAAYVGTYNIGNNIGRMVINEDNTVRITIQGKTYAGALKHPDIFGEKHYITLTEYIPLAWDYNFLMGKYVTDCTYSLYIDKEKQFLYFDDTALAAKDENKRWEITKVASSGDFTESSQEVNLEDVSQDNSVSDSDFSMSASEMIELGEKYEKGIGTEKDPQKAFYYYEKAAATGDAVALNKLGNMYASGLGCTQDSYMAANLYRQAAEKGNMYAQSNIAWCYWDGKGVEKDRDTALQWLRRSAAQGYKPAIKFLEEMETE